MAVTAKKIEYRTEAHAKADELLSLLKDEQGKIDKLNAEYSEKVSALGAPYKVAIRQKSEDLGIIEKRLKKLMKANRDEFFAESDRVDLKCGALLFAILERVKRTKDVLRRLEETGADEAIIVTRSVNWDLLEDWTDERLIEIGTERKRKEEYSYEIFSGGK
jgi:phage host-nuclease inhibitor protein Gam